MNVIAIETTGPFASVAIINDNNDLEEIMGDEKMNHLKNVVPMIQTLLERNDLTMEDVDMIAVSRGPGSFTGIRIGVSTARALSQATGIPVMAIPTLAAFGCGEGEEGELICPLLDARRSQVYAGAYRDFEEVVEGGPYMLDEFLEKLVPYNSILFVGDGLGAYEERVQAWAEAHGKTYRCEEVYQSAGNVAEYAVDTCTEESLLTYDQVQPDYMRRPEAERKREAQLKGEPWHG
jgi:tRNA threonylcarbamoyladenosine biosynthesis protein TsaB